MTFDTMDEDEVMNEINMTPLVDVMLVLLIIFIITVPAIQHSIKLDLPNAANRPNDAQAPHINVGIKANGSLSWDGLPIASNQFVEKITAASAAQPQPELHLYADRQTPYERVAQVMATAQSSGLTRIGFVTNPKNKS